MNINVVNHEECCGCEACVSICAKKSIDFVEDQEGFLFPTINDKECTNCGLCVSVCPVMKIKEYK